MKVSVGQLYIQAGVDFPFSFEMQSWISKELSALASPGPSFLKSYGRAFELVIRLSAKAELRENEIRGPTVFKKDKDVEYTLFLPFERICEAGAGSRRLAAEKFVDGVAAVFVKAGIEAPDFSKRRATLIKRLATDDKMLDAPWPVQTSRFPDDENGAVLKHMAARGMDLTSPRTIEFDHCFPSEAAARGFLAEVEDSVREATLIPPDVEAESGWEVQCRERMVPTHAAITATERRLAKAAKRFGGYADGWGALSNSDGSPA